MLVMQYIYIYYYNSLHLNIQWLENIEMIQEIKHQDQMNIKIITLIDVKHQYKYKYNLIQRQPAYTMRSKSACRNRDITPGPGEYKNNAEEFKSSSVYLLIYYY